MIPMVSTLRGQSLRGMLLLASMLGAAMPAHAATAGEFSILSMNVAGLPALFNSNEVPGDKKTNSGTMGRLFSQYDYDVIHMQEDFNYHAYIYATDTHPYRTATSGGAGFGSGLNTIANFDWVDFRRVKWATCSDASQNDCLTPKGFTFMRAAVARSADNTTAAYADFYNLHADAGTEPGDNAARTANLEQVRDYIATWSAGNAVLVFGDTNSRYSRSVDVGIRELLASPSAGGAGMTDPWVEFERAGAVPTQETLCDNPSTTNACETVDKVFYRSSPLLTLRATGFEYASAKFLQADGKSVLSDHNPVNVNFTWAAGTTLQQSDFWGGPHGNWFSDVPTLAAKTTKPKASVLTFSGASRVDYVAVKLADGTTLSHGGTGGTATGLTLGASEYWTGARLCQGQKGGHTRIFSIAATTSAGRSVQAGTATGDCRSFSAPAGWQIVGFVGQDGDEVDQLAFVYAPQ